MSLNEGPRPIHSLATAAYALSVIAAGVLYVTGAVPATPGVVGLQIAAWTGGLTFALIACDREEAGARA